MYQGAAKINKSVELKEFEELFNGEYTLAEKDEIDGQQVHVLLYKFNQSADITYRVVNFPATDFPIGTTFIKSCGIQAII